MDNGDVANNQKANKLKCLQGLGFSETNQFEVMLSPIEPFERSFLFFTENQIMIEPQTDQEGTLNDPSQ